MAYQTYIGAKDMVIEKNGVVIYEGKLIPPSATSDWLTRINTDWNSTSGTVQSGDIAWGGDEYIAAYSMSLYYQCMERCSPQLKGDWIQAQMTEQGDTMYIYNKLLGKNYSIKIYRPNGSWNAALEISYNTPNGPGTNRSIIMYDIDSSMEIMYTLGFFYNPDNDRMGFGLWYQRKYTPYRQNDVWHFENCIVSSRSYIPSWFSQLRLVFLFDDTPVPPGPGLPYGDDDYTEPVGADGDHDDTSDEILLPAIPLAAATRSGMCTAYVPTWGEIQSVADALIDPNVAQAIWQNVAKISDVIIGLSIFPCVIPATNTENVCVNLMGVHINTGVSCHYADDQFVEFDCGTLDIDEYWGNCLDYNPYTSISIFLPFCGMYELDVDEVMGKELGLTYRVDIMSGACLAIITIDGSVFYQYSGQCSAQVPLSSVTFDGFMASMIELGVATATGVKAIGAAGSAMEAAGKVVPDAKHLKESTENYEAARDNYTAVKEKAGNNIAGAAVGAVMGSKGFYQHAGAMSGSPGFLGVRKPYVIIKRPEQLIPSTYGMFHGYPCNTNAKLGDLTGYTEVDDIRLNIPDATVDEIIECEQLLKGGVVL